VTRTRRVYVTQKIELDGIRYEVVPTGGTKATVYRRTKRDGPLRKVTDLKEWTRVLIALGHRHERDERRRQAIDAVGRAES